jgi:hypothetical protein
VIRIVARGTIEEAVLSLHEERRQLAASILDGADAAARLDGEDLLDLIRKGTRASGPHRCGRAGLRAQQVSDTNASAQQVSDTNASVVRQHAGVLVPTRAKSGRA